MANTYVHPYDIFDVIICECEGVREVDGKVEYPLVRDLVSDEDEHFIYDMCEKIADGLGKRHPEWRR